MNGQMFRYKGYNSSGVAVDGEIMAQSLEEAERRVQSRDVILTVMQPIGKGASTAAKAETKKARGKKVSDGEAALILRNLSVMLDAGVPFVEALDGVAVSAKPDAASYLHLLKEELVAGKSVSGSMRTVPNLFPTMVSDMVRVAEEGGELAGALDTAASHLERSSEFRKKIVNAMIYPAVMVGVSMMTVSILIVFVMPRFAGIFSKMDVKLPWTTQAMLAFGDAIRSRPLVTVGAIVGTFFLIRFVLSLPAGRAAASSMVRRIPILGELVKRLAVSRAFSAISTLLEGNVSVMAALEQGAAVAGDAKVADALTRARSDLEHGGGLYDSLKATKAIPEQLMQMIAVGERTGNLAKLIAAGAARMEEDVDARLKALVALVEPLMIVVMGAVVGTITVSIITPIYSVIENIK